MGAAREPWRLLLTWDGEPGWNMALDEALLEGLPAASGGHAGRPTLRFYTWKPAALSLGYFQAWNEVAAPTDGSVLVRRFSGGGAIHHGEELTFSIAASQEHALFRGEVRRSYERIHAWLAQAFATLGLAAHLAGETALASDRAATGMCFHRSTPFDLAWDGAKGVGSAQRRRGGRVLHHGSIKLGASPREEGVATLRAHAPGLNAAALAELLAGAAARAWNCALTPEPPTAAEHAHAALRASFYRSEAFVRRR